MRSTHRRAGADWDRFEPSRRFVKECKSLWEKIEDEVGADTPFGLSDFTELFNPLPRHDSVSIYKGGPGSSLREVDEHYSEEHLQYLVDQGYLDYDERLGKYTLLPWASGGREDPESED